MQTRRDDPLSPRDHHRRRWRLSPAAIAAAAVIQALVPLAAPAAAAGERSMDRSADGSTVTLVQGGSVRLTLPLNAGTGYEWRLLQRPAAVVAVSDGGAAAAAQRPGGPVAQAFDITGVAPGSADLRFALLRPWEKDAAPADRFSVTIAVTRP